jgi:hypothetical protein
MAASGGQQPIKSTGKWAKSGVQYTIQILNTTIVGM